jgi:hypothetical protein
LAVLLWDWVDWRENVRLIALVILTSAGMAAGSEAPVPLGSGPICPQMAATLPLKPPGKTQKNQDAWRFDSRGGIKGLFAGGASMTFGVTPADEADATQWQRAARMCETVGHGGECRVEGPIDFFVKFDDKSFTWRFPAGGKVLFRAKGTVMECEELALLAEGEADV